MGKNLTVSTQSVSNAPESENSSALALLLRLLWMIIGPVTVVLISIQMFHRRAGFGIYDVAFWCLIAVMLAARYIDIGFMNGRTASNEPATPKVFRAYAMVLLATALVGWAALHAYGLLSR